MERTTLYTLSHLMNAWHIHRYNRSDQDISIVAQDIASEEEALQLALKLAGDDRPSKVLRIDRLGENEVIMTYE